MLGRLFQMIKLLAITIYYPFKPQKGFYIEALDAGLINEFPGVGSRQDNTLTCNLPSLDAVNQITSRDNIHVCVI